MINLEEILSDRGVFQVHRLAIIGKDRLSKEVALFCASREQEVVFFSDMYDAEDIDNINFIPLEEGKGRNRWSHLKNISFIIVSSCSGTILEEILFAAIDFSRIMIIGPIEGILCNTDFYSTVHLKNLELILLSFERLQDSYE